MKPFPIISLLIDKTIERMKLNKFFTIISNNPQPICDFTIKTNPESIVVSLMASHNVEAPAEDTEEAEEK